MAVGAIFFTIGVALQAGAINVVILYVPRLLSGAGIGILSMVVPVYIAEISPEHQREHQTRYPLASCYHPRDRAWRISYGENILFSMILLPLLIKMP
jgi:MFS family permease